MSGIRDSLPGAAEFEPLHWRLQNAFHFAGIGIKPKLIRCFLSGAGTWLNGYKQRFITFRHGSNSSCAHQVNPAARSPSPIAAAWFWSALSALPTARPASPSRRATAYALRHIPSALLLQAL